ncbi:rRNA maturation RNase YbeY [Neolewinella lacunae]|uniref:Endoribonuclease YbeY n=1 Tax=Neolewinella lacunae TaxID=1517758 RepID=A0A923PQB4_9BACT|nr:rRNA maturation RNase YbeY [Neolewinella lacunae]MBC6995836.1 rRNA maturation RNase YbeY [Neolewinella lacunae]MDN3636471.1 rRNA maturation RNase YbeY [Neolewinella lacunae]
MEHEILFHVEEGGTPLSEAEESKLQDWILEIISARGGQAGAINYIFCGDEYLHQLNVEYLGHDTLTDIITFPYEHFPVVGGDLFISTERVAENARELGLAYPDELHRVIIHGILHLCGQGDKSDLESARMRELEDWALGLRPGELAGK